MKKTRRQAFYKFFPLYLPYLLLSIASAFLLYLGILTITRHQMACLFGHDLLGCGYSVTKVRIGELIAEITAYLWFLFAQVAFHHIYTHRLIYSAKRRRDWSFSKLASSIYCLSVTVLGLCGIMILTWRVTLSSL